jgi:hypothetical protein
VGPTLRHRLLDWLADPAVASQDPETTSTVRAGLRASDDWGWLVSLGRHGTVICSARSSTDGPPRRVIELDRHGTLLTVARWDEPNRLRWAKFRLPDGRWVGIEPRSTRSGAWGESDRLWLLGDGAPFRPLEELGHFQAVEYLAVAAIPPLAEPRRLPPGAGTAVLNFLSNLLVEQGASRVFYRGPYATEQLFTALLESFRYAPAAPAPLRQFVESDLAWTPAPHERRFLPQGIYIQLRDGVEKVVFRGKAYYRRQWQSVIRAEPRVIREEEGRVLCSLYALGTPVEDHLVLDADGEVAEIPETAPESGDGEPLSPAWRAALNALLAHQTAPALAPWLGQALQALRLEWGPVGGDLLEVSGELAVLSLKLPRLFRRRLADCQTRAEGLWLAVALVSEVARLLGPTVRLRAQAILASLPEAAQQAALENPAAGPPLTPLEDLAQTLAAGAGCP